MSIGKWLLAKINALLIWRVLLGVVVLANVGVAVAIWMSGGKETSEAMESGRRLLYTLADGKIEGRQITSEELAKSLKPQDALAEQKPEDTVTPEVPPAPEKPAEQPTAPEVTAPAAETPAANTEQPAPEPAGETTTQETPADATQPTAVTEPALTTETSATTPTDASVAAAPADGVVPPADATQAEPTVELPAQAASDESQAGPVAPEPPTVDSSLPPVPADTSSVPTLLPEAAPVAPLKNQSAPAIKPSSQKMPEFNPLITEKTPDGTVPVVAHDGTKAWKYYAKPFTLSGKQPMVAIVITGLGHNKLVTEHALALSEHVTLSFSPYAREVEKWASSARIAGHEVTLDLPLEPANFPATDPGPYGLITNKPQEDNESRLRWLMSRVSTSVGFVSPRNERYTASPEHLKLLLQSLANRGLMVVLTRDTSKDEAKEVLENTTAANLTADFLIDEDLSEATIKAKLASIEQLATQRGYAVGIAQPYPVTIAQLKLWMESLAGKGIVLVPISTIAKQKFS